MHACPVRITRCSAGPRGDLRGVRNGRRGGRTPRSHEAVWVIFYGIEIRTEKSPTKRCPMTTALFVGQCRGAIYPWSKFSQIEFCRWAVRKEKTVGDRT
jgi:hypothetical protein